MANKTQNNIVSTNGKSQAGKSQNGTEKSSKSGSASQSVSSKKTLEDLFEEELKDIYSAEKQLVEALPDLAKAAHNEELEEAFSRHLEQTKKHVERIEKIFDRLQINKEEEEKCYAMEGLIEEGQRIIQDFEEGPVRDSALIIASQKVEHYEIAAYGSLCELADVLGYDKICSILDRTLEEEESTDALLTDIAQDVNDEAHAMSEEEEEVY
ncbi:MAG: ferritin-like domain-containing protein [Bacteroidia bacterium]